MFCQLFGGPLPTWSVIVLSWCASAPQSPILNHVLLSLNFFAFFFTILKNVKKKNTSNSRSTLTRSELVDQVFELNKNTVKIVKKRQRSLGIRGKTWFKIGPSVCYGINRSAKSKGGFGDRFLARILPSYRLLHLTHLIITSQTVPKNWPRIVYRTFCILLL